MKLATLRDGSRDGRLVVVRRDLGAFADAGRAAPTLQAALDDWDRASRELLAIADELESGRTAPTPFDPRRFMSPLPRAYEWIDGSAYLSHVTRVRRARGAEPPKGLEQDPLVYQGGSGVMLGPTDPILLGDPSWDVDFEAELCVVLRDTQANTPAETADRQVALVTMVNDITLRGLVAAELAKGFGFFLSKPASAFAPVAVTPDELGPAWRGGRAYLLVRCTWNGQVVGEIDAGLEMHFSFAELIAHITRTRSFVAGTLLGGGTVSCSDPRCGTACLVERRALEIIEGGKASTRYLLPGDTIVIEAFDSAGRSVFGRIEQMVTGA